MEDEGSPRRRRAVGLLLMYAWTARVGCSLSANLVRYRARVAYDGTGFSGFQLQNNGKRTVQACLEQVLTRRCNQKQVVRVVAAGRTDTGVHARGQAIHFDLPAFLPTDELRQIEESLNKMLPPDVCLWNLQHAPPPILKSFQNDTGSVMTKEMTWNVIYDSTSKLYSYRLSLAPVMDPLQRYHRWHPDALKGKPIQPETLRRLLQYYEGTHDFRAFAGSIEQLQRRFGRPINTTKTVYSVDLVDEGDGCFRIDFLLKGALYKQVRNMVGTALDAARGVTTEEEFRRLIHQDDEGCSSSLDADDGSVKRESRFTRAFNPSKPAPPEGLTLENVFFDNDEEF